MSRCDYIFPDGRHCVLRTKHDGDHSNLAVPDAPVLLPRIDLITPARFDVAFTIVALCVIYFLAAIAHHVGRVADALEAQLADPTHARD